MDIGAIHAKKVSKPCVNSNSNLPAFRLVSVYTPCGRPCGK
jgi:hypothetical protein